jgi:hypothetical protein
MGSLMRPAGSRSRVLLWALPVAILGLVIAIVLLPRVTPGPSRPATPVTRKRPLDLRRHRDVAYTNEYLYDSTYETCEALGITQLAHKLGVCGTSPPRVAKAFAEQNYASALRVGPYHGCLDALLSQLREARRRSR